MPIENFDFVGSYNNQRFPNIDAERTINMFEYLDAKGKKPKSLISTSGILDTGIVFPGASPADGFRAEFVLNGFEYYVIGPNIFRRDSQNVIVPLNNQLTQPFASTTNNGYVGIDANNASTGSQILFVNGEMGCIWDTGSQAFTYNVILVDPAFPSAPYDVCFIDGFLLVAHGTTNQFQLSALNNAYSWGLVENTVTFNSVTNQITIVNPNVLTPFIPTIFSAGMEVQFSIPNPPNTGILPAVSPPPTFVANTSYYVIPVFSSPGVLDPVHIQLATTYAKAVAGIPDIIFTNNGTTPLIAMTNAGINANLTQAFAPGQLQLGAINSHPGNIVACRTLHRRIFLFSTNYVEVWENAGVGTNLPLRRNNALLMEFGTPSIGSIVTGFDKMIFLAQDKDGLASVMEVDGTSSIPISNRALDFQLSQYAQMMNAQGVSIGVSDARGIFIKENGIIFYRLNFTTANHTFVYNVTLSNPQSEEGKLWHEEQTLNGDRHPAQTHGYFNGDNYYGSYNSPVLYQVDQSFVTNNGEAIPRIRIGRAYCPSTYTRLRIDRFMVDIIQGFPVITDLTGIIDLLAESGLIIDTESAQDILLDQSQLSTVFSNEQPPVFLSYSKDGGVTFGYRQTSYLGAIGDRKHRTVWRKLGVIPRGQAFVPRLEFFSELPFTILGAAWFYEALPE